MVHNPDWDDEDHYTKGIDFAPILLFRELEAKPVLVDEWYRQAAEMRSQVFRGYTALLKLSDEGFLSDDVVKIRKAAERNHKQITRRYEKYLQAWTGAREPGLTVEQREAFRKEWSEHVAEIGLRMVMLTHAWNAFRTEVLRSMG